MRKLFALGITLAIVATLVGCKRKSEESSGSSDDDGGNSREKIVQDFCEAFRLCDSSVLSEIMKEEFKSAYGGSSEEDFLTPLRKMARSDKPVKTKVLRSFAINRRSASYIEATCDGVDTLYFLVGHKTDSKEDKDKIRRITADWSVVEKGIKKAEELEEAEREKKSGGVKMVSYSDKRVESQKAACISYMKALQTAGETWKTRPENCTKMSRFMIG